jgi:hypothetical protein
LRYSLVPFVLITLAGWFCFYQLFFAGANKGRKLLVVVVLMSLAFFSIVQYGEVRKKLMRHPRTKNPYYINLYGSQRWIDKNLPENILVASNEDQEGYFMHRPFISMPPEKSYSCTNLELFNRIYAPDYYLLSLSVGNDCFARIPHAEVFSNKGFRILKVKKDR